VVKKFQWLFPKKILIQIGQYFIILAALIVLFYAAFYAIYASYFDEHIERTRGVLTISVILGDMLGIVCATIFPVAVPFLIVFGHIRSKRIYVPVVSMYR